MPQDLEIPIETNDRQTLTELSRHSVIRPRPRAYTNKNNIGYDVYSESFDDSDTDSKFTVEDRNLTDLVEEEIKNFQNKVVPFNHDQKIKFDIIKWWEKHKQSSLFFYYSKSICTSLQHLFHQTVFFLWQIT